ncbi:MAG: ATP-binding protein [Thermoplasmatota archaeon]
MRLSLVAFNSVAYLAFLHPSSNPGLAIGVIVVANLYAVAVVLGLQAKWAPLRTGIWVTGTDSALIVAWLLATGGANSPFFLLWGVSLVAIAHRFGARETVAATLLYVGLEIAMVHSLGWTVLPVVRVAYIGFIGAICSSMAGANTEIRMHGLEWEQTRADLMDKTAQLEAITENVPGILIRASLDGRVEFISKVAPGFIKEQVLGNRLVDFVPPDQAHVIVDALEKVKATRAPTSYTVKSETADGLRTFFSDIGPMFHGAQLAGVIIHTQDITEKLQQEERAQEAQMQAFALEQLEEQDRFRRDLLNTVAHELNNPLTPLKLQLHVLEKQENIPQIGILRRNVGRLEHLIGDLLEVARMDNADLTLKRTPVDVGTLIAEAVETFAPMAEANDIQLKVEPGTATWSADAMRLSQVIYNLVSNSLKFGAKHVRVGCSEDALFVEDDGPGFAEDQLAQLFEPFSQIHPATVEGQAGTGLGLYLCKRIMEAHGGELQVMSKGLGNGATFRATIPASIPSSPPAGINEP